MDDRAEGMERFGREIAGTLINPVGTFNRLIRGDMSRRNYQINHFRYHIEGYLASAGSGCLTATDMNITEFEPAIDITLHYGQPFIENDHYKPFDYFNFRFWTSRSDRTRNLTILA